LPVIGTADVFGRAVPLLKYTGLPPAARATGDLEQMSLLDGESVGLIGAVLPAREITLHLAQEIDATLRDRIGDSIG